MSRQNPELGQPSRILFDDDKSLIRFDMSEYMEKQSVNRLLGADPGFVGFEEGGLLTEGSSISLLSSTF